MRNHSDTVLPFQDIHTLDDLKAATRGLMGEIRLVNATGDPSPLRLEYVHPEDGAAFIRFGEKEAT